MTDLSCRRGEVRAALSALLPHAGKATDDTPDFGRIRLRAGGDELLAWATDGFTSAVARMTVDEHRDDELDEWDMSIHEVKAVLAVLKRPGNANEQSVWDSAECRIRLLGRRVRFTEEGDLFGGRDVTVNRLEHIDTYPDVPRGLHAVLTAVPPHHPHTNVRTDLLVRFVASGKAYDDTVVLRPSADPASLLFTVGNHFTGQLRTMSINANDAANYEGDWATRLAPLRRPVAPIVPADVMDNLRDQAARFFAEEHHDGITLTVTSGGEDS